MRKTVLVPIADGTEEIEAVCIIDVLRRSGAEVIVASVEKDLRVTASRGLRIVADALLSQCAARSYDMIVLPGGMPGAERLRDSEALTALLRRHRAEDRAVGAICAAPAVVLEALGMLEGIRATCHPAFADRMNRERFAESRVVVDGGVITSRGPGTALEFALTLVAVLFGQDRAKAVAGPMLIHGEAFS